MEHRYRIGADVGGTFTDFVLIDYQTGTQWSHKLLTSAADPSLAVLDGFREIVEQAVINAGDVDIIVHGTTLIANALIERKGARTGLLTTKGFEDLLEISREQKYEMYSLEFETLAPLVPAEFRVGVPERTIADGSHEMDEAGVETAIEDLLSREPEAVAICFLHAYLNGHNEAFVSERLRTRNAQIPISLSSRVMPEIREYERLSTTVANAYVQGLVADYLQRIVEGLTCSGFEGPPLPQSLPRRPDRRENGHGTADPARRVRPRRGLHGRRLL